MNQVLLCLFDMDGVLFDSEIYFMDILIREAASYFGVSIPDKTPFYAPMAGKSSFDMLDIACGLLDVSKLPKEEQLKFSARADSEIHNLILNREIPLKGGLVDFLAFLDAQGISKAICSNSPLPLIQKFISAYGLNFDSLLSADSLGELKPSPLVYVEGMSQHGVSFQNTLIFEDSLVGIKQPLQVEPAVW